MDQVEKLKFRYQALSTYLGTLEKYFRKTCNFLVSRYLVHTNSEFYFLYKDERYIGILSKIIQIEKSYELSLCNIEN